MRSYTNAKKIGSIASVVVFLVLFFYAEPAKAFFFDENIGDSKALAYYTIGYTYDLMGMPESAVPEYEKAVQFDEGSYLIHLRLGAGYARLGMLAKAQEQLLLVQQFNPKDLQSHYLLALIYSTQQQYEKAAVEYEHILNEFSKVEPQNIEIYGYLGQLYYSQKKYDKAIEQFEKILKIDTQNADVMYLLGSIYLDVQRKDEAIALFKNSISIDPFHDGSLNTLGYLYAENDIYLDEALLLVNRALAISPENGAYLDSLGWVYFKMGKYDEALSTLQKADKLLEDAVIYEHMGDVYYKMSKIDEAIKHWNLSLGLEPQQPKVIQKINEAKNIHQASM